ncbi:MAG: acyl carrier protein [Candidatus Alectryocaccobium sp.]|jgi:acyl carrier protein|nr:acyl carrier protein [Lachnospiraceae bacterium]MDY6220895.1 acyl carrier protein [Candidatus Alectryocaccobium sp.]
MLEKLKQLLSEQFGYDESTITEDTDFKDDLGADSLDLFEMVMALEEEYSVEIPAEDLSDINTVGDIINYLREKGVEL